MNWTAGNYLSLRRVGQAPPWQSILRKCPQDSHRSRLCQSDQELLDASKYLWNGKWKWVLLRGWMSYSFPCLHFFRFFWTTALIQSHNIFGQFLSKVAVDADIREKANDIKKSWEEVFFFKYKDLRFRASNYRSRLTWVWEKTPLRGSWPSASWLRRWTWTWRPPGGCWCWKTCCTVKLFALQVFEEKVGEWKKEWSSTHWRWARRVQAGEEEDIRAGLRLPVVP